MKWVAFLAAIWMAWTSPSVAQEDLDSLGALVPLDSSAFLDSLPSMPFWIPQFTVRIGGGYNDNITLSPVAPEGSAFLSFGMDGILTRLPTGRTQFDLFFMFDDLRYLSSISVDKEELGFAQAQLKYELSEVWLTSLALEYLYQDQVLDVSTTEADLRVALVRGHSIMPRPGLRANLPRQCWLALEFPVNRQFFDEPLDNYWEYGPKLVAGKTYGHKSEATLSYQYVLRPYDTDPELDAAGKPVVPANTKTLYAQEVLLNCQHYWGEKRHWRTSLRMGYMYNKDNGSGYFDFYKPHGSVQMRYRSANWELSGRVRLAYYHYPVQTVGLEQRERLDTLYSVRGERRVGESLLVFAEYEHNRTYSNQSADAYAVNRVNAGLGVEF